MTELINTIDMNMSFNDHNIRIFGTTEKPLFVVKDICKVLGLTNTTETTRLVPEKWRYSKILNTSSGAQNTNVITEAGLYKIVMRSNKPIAQKFQDFVCEEILPSIRKKGEYKLQKLLDEKNKEMEEKNKEIKDLHRLVKRKERKKFRKGFSIYLLGNPDIEGYIKVGETDNINRRVGNYTQGAPKPYDVLHHRLLPSQANQKAVETMLLTILDPYRVENEIKNSRKREWLDNIDLETVKEELDGIVDYINDRRRFYNPECNIYDEKEDDSTEEDSKNEHPTKKCSVCLKDKPLEAYYDRKANVDGKEKKCKRCYLDHKSSRKPKHIKILEEDVKNLEKQCRKCTQSRPLIEFQPHGTSKDGFGYVCITCREVKPIFDITEKKCAMCQEIQPINNFSRCCTSPDGKSSYCKKCSSIRSKEYREKNKERLANLAEISKIEITEKVCNECGEEKPAEDFWKNKRKKDGRHPTCKVCCSYLKKIRKGINTEDKSK